VLWGRELGCYMGSAVKILTFQIQAVTVYETVTGRGVDLKMETLWRKSCIQ
jgi:hypothetical protein